MGRRRPVDPRLPDHAQGVRERPHVAVDTDASSGPRHDYPVDSQAGKGLTAEPGAISETYDYLARYQTQRVELRRDILARHDIRPERVLAHSDVAPNRKTDPGEKFDWGRLAGAGIGHWVEPTRIEGDAGLALGDEGAEVARLQRRLGDYGYDIAESGRFCEHTQIVVTAFQRHFRPALVNGRADHSTIDTLDRLIRGLDC